MTKAEEKSIVYQLATHGPRVIAGDGILSDEELKFLNINYDFKAGYEQAEKDLDNCDWNAFRRETAKDIVCAILSAGMEQTDDNDVRFYTFESLAKKSVEWANELIKQLKKEEEE